MTRGDMPTIFRLMGGLLVATSLGVMAGACSTSEPNAGTVANPSGLSSATPNVDIRPGAMARPSSCLATGEGTYAVRTTRTQWVTPVLLLGSGSRGVVLGAQSNGGICQMLPFARELVALGYHVATFEWGLHATDSMGAATAALLEAGAARVVVGGFSEGAVIGLGGATSFGPSVVGVLAVSGGPSPGDGYPTVESVSTYPGALLLIGATSDTVFPPDTNRAIAAAHLGPEEILELPGSGHALELLEGEHAAQVRSTITEFLRRVLG